LQLSWTIFDRFTTNLRVEQSLINYRNQELQYEDLKIRVVAEVRQALGDYQAALKQLESTSKGLAIGKASLRDHTEALRSRVGDVRRSRRSASGAGACAI
jgi:outer membrane protein TolC